MLGAVDRSGAPQTVGRSTRGTFNDDEPRNGHVEHTEELQMSLGYALAYRVGLTPWERAGQAAAHQFTSLLDREESERTRPLGRALDIGCGTGLHTLELAARGWDTIGIDNVTAAIDKARARPATASVRFVLADVTDLAKADIGPKIDFLLDIGCFQGLDDRERRAYAREVTTMSGPDATLLMLSFQPGRRIGLPRGASRAELEATLPEWTVIDDALADTSGMPGPMKKTAPHWFRLKRR